MTTPGLFISNRLEILAEALAEVVCAPLRSPLIEEVILVQSRGMERWLSMELARRHGICANYRFPFPNAFVYELFRKVFQDLPEQSPFDPKTMTWKIMKCLPSCITKPGFEGLRHYLNDGKRDLKRLQLAERIADTFDQYLVFRPEMILSWERNKEDHWQAVLWRELVKEGERGHPARLRKAFLEAIETCSVAVEGLPERISVFGISSLPRFHMEVLAGLSHLIQVNLFLMNPCKAYWGDIVSDWEVKRTMDSEGAGDLTLEALHLEKGNSLLASMGTLGRDFFDLFHEFDWVEMSSFEDPGEDTLLSCLQSDILNLRDTRRSSDERYLLAHDDTSVQIHSCHSPMRETEVLYDRLLDMFEKDPELLPRDVLVMTPDIETYGPYIRAVFDVPADDPRRFPFTIADQSAREESQIIDTFLAVLDLIEGRFSASQVLSILESKEVQRKLGLSEADVALIQRWVKDTRIRWGENAKSRGRLGLPALPENTWEAGLKRLLLGYAMAGQGENTFGDILPYDGVEGGEAWVLGVFLQFFEQLHAHILSLRQPRTLDAWSETLTDLLERLFSPNEDTESDMQLTRRALKDFADMQQASGFDEPIDFRVVQWHLRRCFEKEGFGFGFMAGGITFCAMLPMRSIPFKIICLLGMNIDSYPRQSKPLGFDLMARDPKKGDRSRRNDDRYLFLEAMVSARDMLYISYVGQSIQDNSVIHPSVLVSELMDYIAQGYEVPGAKVLDHIVTKHRLQAFSPDYFRPNEKLFSYSQANCDARNVHAPFISKGLSGREETWKTVRLEDLCRFFANPARFLLNRRLGIHLEEKGSILEDREAFDLKGLERYLLEKDLLEKRLAGRSLKELLPLIKAAGRLPHGAVGEYLYEEVTQGIERFVQHAQVYTRGERPASVEVNLSLSHFKLTGAIDTVFSERLMQCRYARVQPTDHLRLWVHHLVLNSLKGDYCPRASVVAGLHPQRAKREWAAWEYAPVEHSEEILEGMLAKYWQGLVKPLHFFPRSAWVYATMRFQRDLSRDDALHHCRGTWKGNEYSRGEREDVYYQLCFGNTDPLDLEFESTAEELFGMLFKFQTEIKDSRRFNHDAL
jgi:exodeoxyribonuclease V gamma subunit